MNIPTSVPAKLGGSTSTAGQTKTAGKEPYQIKATNWYQSLPYGFAFWDINSKSSDYQKSTIYLPIAPNNLTVNTSFATNLITTLYGIVEEHSEVRYYDITISGTTGFAPRFVGAFDGGAYANSLSTGRSSFKAKTVPDLGGFLPEVTNTINQVLDVANDIGNAIGGGNTNPTGIDPEKSGYVAFHNLYKFFLKYKQDTSQMDAAAGAKTSSLPIALPAASAGPKRQHHPIEFLNYKDGVKYDCVPLSFTMVRSADKPMEYIYTIRLRAFNLRDVHAKAPVANQLEKLGIGGIKSNSAFSKMTSIAGNASTVISGLF